ncbi:hypothetical protein LEP1GSC043_1521 [Leptospira weilii str. Ecochallenge]|uniref:Uncharacterized protein n=1 Tax=Leptospira weilii str. Ecochallenge TaxID=1049986 RepID=N1U8E6_9LEPT|nr:hypothetical protein LEP1GSC043_1521 [Leptospira weilii str. Ecochallenge]
MAKFKNTDPNQLRMHVLDFQELFGEGHPIHREASAELGSEMLSYSTGLDFVESRISHFKLSYVQESY